MEYIKDWMPLAVASVAIIVSAINYTANLRIGRQSAAFDFVAKQRQAEFDAKLRRVEIALGIQRDQAMDAIAAAISATTALQKFKNQLTYILSCSKEPGSLETDTALLTLELCRKDVEAAHMTAEGRVEALKFDALHRAKNKALEVFEFVRAVLRGTEYVPTLPNETTDIVANAIKQLSDAQNQIRDFIARKQIELTAEALADARNSLVR